jgi:hypothetical protein
MAKKLPKGHDQKYPFHGPGECRNVTRDELRTETAAATNNLTAEEIAKKLAKVKK